MFLRSIVEGYEVANRVTEALGPAHYRLWHTTGAAGCIAAAAAAGLALGLPVNTLVHALALAATMDSGLQRTIRTGSTGKPLHSGHAAAA
ncbi:MmgE/PrpD family protein [Streptomyces brasiliensis]|uniref:MmgE/PrpD N-terminal domain-containing protein n=1 Tax=Streptomyces brasiliensis TaxID=1954 RepID=A0A917L3H9_9ACTN|nr:MmgE/PrpD family protein [Streptomyces brasiliensis]GGJ42946.1 hypothetical protein GCM10010121_062740 [Streptomyces brasiliensis]